MSIVAFSSAFVIDASVLIKLLLPEDGSELARSLWDPARSQPASARVVPDLLFVECANILQNKIRRGLLTSSDARLLLADLLAVNVLQIPAVDLLPEALDLAMAHRITVYDAVYVALAKDLAMPLITADERLARDVGDSSLVMTLASFGTP